MNDQETRWFAKLKRVIGQSKSAELLETRKETLGWAVPEMGRRDFMKFSGLAGAMMGALAIGNRVGVVSPKDVTNRVKELGGAGLNVVKSSAGVILPDPLAARQSYLQWLGVKEVAAPTYERFFTGDTLPATISFKSSDYPKLNTAGTTPETYVPAATNLLGSSDPNPASEIAADIFEMFPYKPVNPATLNSDDRIWYEFEHSFALSSATNVTSTLATAVSVSPNQVTGVDSTQWSFLMKKFGLMLGMTNVGITQTKPNVHIGTDALAFGYYGTDGKPLAAPNTVYPSLIVMGVAEPNALNRMVDPTKSPLGITNVGNYIEAVYDQNADFLNLATLKIANFIKNLGYNAIPLAIASGVFQVPMLIDAGFGEGSRCSRCLTPDYGHLVSPTAVMTDMPLAYDSPIDFNLYNFCMRCEVCTTTCPSGSRATGAPTPPRNALNRAGMKYWYDAPACQAYWSSFGGCQLCEANCVWSEPRTWYHDLAKWAAINMGNTGIDTLVSLYKGDIANRQVQRSSYLWSTTVEQAPRWDVNTAPPW